MSASAPRAWPSRPGGFTVRPQHGRQAKCALCEVSPQHLLSSHHHLPASAPELGSGSSGSRPAGPRHGEDMTVDGLAQDLTHFSLSAQKPRGRGPGNPRLRVASGNSCLAFSSSGSWNHVPRSGWALIVLKVPGMAPAESPRRPTSGQHSPA